MNHQPYGGVFCNNIMDIILKYFPHLSQRQREQFAALGSLYPEWNEKINVISRKDIMNLYPNHVLHSLAIARFLDGYGAPVDGTTFLDLGTGGGFPGIPLAIMYPQCRFHLIDRIGKKIKVAQSISESIGLTNVTFQHGDIGECKLKADFVVSRAVMRLDSLLPLIKKNISPISRNRLINGLICLKGGDIGNETPRNVAVMDIDITDFFPETHFQEKKLIYVPLSATS